MGHRHLTHPSRSTPLSHLPLTFPQHKKLSSLVIFYIFLFFTAPRSGLAAKHFIDVGAGVVDEDYRGNVGVVLFNFSKETFEVKKGDRVAQLVCERICYPDLQELKTLDETERGAGGFGSTGSN
eukprot:XP_013982964.1 PREDICTED: deoxyuridine 5'-triphosphate nucleotidohydrolase-like [Salmo salar]